jgi:hypothetical protein
VCVCVCVCEREREREREREVLMEYCLIVYFILGARASVYLGKVIDDFAGSAAKSWGEASSLNFHICAGSSL